ncbi:aldo/keto reductase [Paenibacillus ihbetae]|uniref:Glyoxal reductase n=1 Tax=Paenibacillus ihbetae TaxID=1870820 RepID=A0ABX3JZR0_9BACL|nr:aldo/keto reductase [Paenibacillus ihbetae]OOC62667.1 glyoxal reductase [Paenibacillus ihbetae]
MNYVTLNNGVKMPQLGFGVFQVGNQETAEAVSTALKIGYTSIDTAMIYKNEEGVREAIKNEDREKLFITTKVWNTDHGYEKTLAAFEGSLERLGLDYIDLYLIHWPAPMYDEYIDTYKALEKLYKDGRVKAIGVCNFEIEHLERLLAETEILPVLNQVECHPYLAQNELKAFCREHNIYVEAWSPLERGGNVLKDQTITKIAEKYGKSPAQVVLRWHLQNHTIVIPKTVTPSRMEENIQVFDFELSHEDMEAINQLDSGRRTGPHPNEMNVR